MSYQYLKERQYYEDLYDRLTVEQGRRDLKFFWQAHDEFFKKSPKEDPKSQRWEFWWDRMCFWLVEIPLGERWEKKGSTIDEWMAKDSAKDEKLAKARPLKEPICKHCGKTGLRIISKDLMNRSDDYSKSQEEQVVFMFECTHCQKRSAYWENGTEWKLKPTLCPKCQATVTKKDTTRGKIITTTYTCPVCAHSFSEKLDLRSKKEKPDPNFKRDRAIFCFDNERGQKYLEYRQHWDELQRLFKKDKEREANKDLYEAVENLEKLKVASLIEKLRPKIEKAGYIEVKFDKPEIDRDFTVGFSCLDSKTERDDYTSRSVLKKTINKTLNGTNWRLMSSGIDYRLGYLNGKLRAYEQEEDLINLVSKGRKQSGSQKNQA